MLVLVADVGELDGTGDDIAGAGSLVVLVWFVVGAGAAVVAGAGGGGGVFVGSGMAIVNLRLCEFRVFGIGSVADLGRKVLSRFHVP